MPSCSSCFVCSSGSLSKRIKAFGTDDGGSRGKDEGEKGRSAITYMYHLPYPQQMSVRGTRGALA